MQVNFLKKKTKEVIYKYVSLFAGFVLVINMSFVGVFFIAPEASANDLTDQQRCVNADFGDYVTKWNCVEGHEPLWGLDNPDDFGTSVTGNCSEASWTASPLVSGVISREGDDYYPHSGGVSGLVEKIGDNINHLIFCRVDEQPECGNEVTEGDEECDDGNQDDYDECNNDCTLPMVEIPVNTCSGDGEIYFYQGDPFQEIDTYFTVQKEQLLIFTKGNVTLNVQVDGSPVSLDLVKEISSIKVFSATTSVGSLISVTGTFSGNARNIQGFLAQDPLSPVYSIETLQNIYKSSTTDDIYLLAGTYNYIFFINFSNLVSFFSIV